MGLFLGPFSGHAVGGAGGGPPPGMGDEAGMRSEVDTTGREPLRLLRTTMNKHKPKFMKIVPPGQQPGTVAPPYVWDARERDDWEYKLDKPKGLGEGEFDAPKLLGATATTSVKDPRHARVDAIQAELRQLHVQVRTLTQRLDQEAQRGKQQVGEISRQFSPQLPPSPYESIKRSGLRLVEVSELARDEYTPVGIHRQEGDPPRYRPDPHSSPLPMPSPAEQKEKLGLQNLRSRGIPTGLESQAPKASFAIIGIHRELDQKQQQIKTLVNELKQLRMQISQQAHESTGLSSNNLHRLSLRLK